MVASESEALRADAQRNREAILAAARRVFAESGPDAPLGLVATEAGVGRATMQRRFPAREDLILALINENMDRLQGVVDKTHGRPDCFLQLLVEVKRIVVRDRSFMDFIYRYDVPASLHEDVARRFLEIAAEPLAEAQQAGLVRPDLTPADTVIVIDMLTGPLNHPVPHDNDLSGTADKTLELILSALGAPRRR
ncbi:TetR/AcrR family transcriptional regulator [Streptomyces sp. NPDC050433]|uniref:TetR/AcrR family transcriptional regulator n=1 Tax=Streptomyces sp. NPDC050433 TaxID=3365615 RepID=UPI00379A9C32